MQFAGKVVASPRVLVNDNTKGQLESVLSVSYASVNASSTVATTSVGGSQDAGTTINVTPHISEGDHLQLEFSIEFSSFATRAAALRCRLRGTSTRCRAPRRFPTGTRSSSAG